MSERIGSERTLAAYEQASAGRETWRIKALEMEADRDRWEARASAVAAAYDELHDTAGQYNAAVNVLARDNTRLEDERDALAAQVQRVRAVQLGLMAGPAKWCDANEVNYSAGAGYILGAVRRLLAAALDGPAESTPDGAA